LLPPVCLDAGSVIEKLMLQPLKSDFGSTASKDDGFLGWFDAPSRAIDL
jgi:hypothetical protein